MMSPETPGQRRCQACPAQFVPQHAGQTFCGALCYGGYVRQHFPLHLPTKAELRRLMTAPAPEDPDHA